MSPRFVLFSRVALSLLILLSGLALIPFAGLSAEKLSWQQFADVYQPELDPSAEDGQPGSAFVFTGSGFAPHAAGPVAVNGRAVGLATSDGQGNVVFRVLMPVDTAPGEYHVTATLAGDTAIATVTLDPAAPLRPLAPDFDGLTFIFGDSVFLPFVPGG